MQPRLLILFVLCFFNNQTSIAQTFLKYYTRPDGFNHSFKKMLPYKTEGYVFISDGYFFRIDNQGSTVASEVLGPRNMSFDHMIWWRNDSLLTVAGNFRGTEPAIRITPLSHNGKTNRYIEFPVPSGFEMLQLVPAAGNGFFLLYVHRGITSSHVDIIYFNDQLQQVWKKELTDPVYQELYAIPGTNGTAEILYAIAGSFEPRHLKIDAASNITPVTVPYSMPLHSTGALRRMVRTPDGGYFYTGKELQTEKNEDIVYLKTNATGHAQWTKRLDIHLGDRCENIAVTDDGYLLLATTGITRQDINWYGADMALIRLDAQGEKKWAKAFGSNRLDYGRDLLVEPDGNILIGGQGTVIFGFYNEPVMLRVTSEGKITHDLFPSNLLHPTQLQILNPDAYSPVQRQTNAVPLPDGGLYSFTSIWLTPNDAVKPFLCRTNREGQTIWNKAVPGGPEMGLMKKLKDGSCLTLNYQPGLFSVNDFSLTQWDLNGNILWTKTVRTSTIKDLLETDDGFILTGSETEAFSTTRFRFMVIKLNKQGEEVWKFMHPIPNKWPTGKSIQLTPEKDILVAGSLQVAQMQPADVFIAKLSSGGQLKWLQSYPEDPNTTSVPNKLIITNNNEYLLTGYVKHYDHNKQDLLLLKTSNTGNLLWKKMYNFNKVDAGTGLVHSGDDYVIGGIAGLQEFGPRESFGFVLRTDRNGEKKGLRCFGQNGLTITCTDFHALQENSFLFTGTTQLSLGNERPFITLIGTVPAPDPTPAEKQLSIYPNPAIRNLWIELTHPYEGDIRLVIYDSRGQNQFQTTARKNSYQVRIPVYLPGLPSGTYLLEVNMNGEKMLRKLVIGIAK